MSSLSDSLNFPFNEALAHQVVVSCLSNMRQVSSVQKNRAEVRGGGKKPWKQKGTGRARAGSSRSPIWRGGGVTFAGRVTRNHKKKINKKVYKVFYRGVLSELNRIGRLEVIENFELQDCRTKSFNNHFKSKQLESRIVDNSVLLLVESLDDNLYLSSRNLSNVCVREVKDIEPLVLVSYSKVLVFDNAVEALERFVA